MAHVSNCLLGIVNLVALLLSIPTIIFTIWLWRDSTMQCGRYIQMPFIILSIVALLLSMAGLFGASCRLPWLMWVYQAMLLAMMVGLLCTTVGAMAVVHEVKGVEGVPGKAYKEFKLEGYSRWMRARVDNNWETIKDCLIKGNVCRSMELSVFMSDQQFYTKTLTPIQSGCCKPSNNCHFWYNSPTNWTRTEESSIAENQNVDCELWRNEHNRWCFDCQSCKAAVLFHLNLSWMKLASVNVVILLILGIIFAIGCQVLKNTRKEGLKRIHDNIK